MLAAFLSRILSRSQYSMSRKIYHFVDSTTSCQNHYFAIVVFEGSESGSTIFTSGAKILRNGHRIVHSSRVGGPIRTRWQLANTPEGLLQNLESRWGLQNMPSRSFSNWPCLSRLCQLFFSIIYANDIRRWTHSWGQGQREEVTMEAVREILSGFVRPIGLDKQSLWLVLCCYANEPPSRTPVVLKNANNR